MIGRMRNAILLTAFFLLVLSASADAQVFGRRFFGGYGSACANGQCGPAAMQMQMPMQPSYGACANGQCGMAAMGYLPPAAFSPAPVQYVQEPIYWSTVSEAVTVLPSWRVYPTRRTVIRWGW